MKIDQDLRAAIRSAEKVQASTDTWEIREANEKKSIHDFFVKYPAKAKRVRQLGVTITKASEVLKKANEELCETFGLREAGKGGFRYAHCDSDRKKFEKAGGKVVRKSEKWRFDSVMAELAAAQPNQLKRILTKYGINWE